MNKKIILVFLIILSLALFVSAIENNVPRYNYNPKYIGGSPIGGWTPLTEIMSGNAILVLEDGKMNLMVKHNPCFYGGCN